jgi:hypothetical protein
MARKQACGPFKKSVNFELYNWCPPPANYNKSSNGGGGSNRNNNAEVAPYFCSATPGNQGFDFISTYVYNVVTINGKPNRLAYVECNYMV